MTEETTCDRVRYSQQAAIACTGSVEQLSQIAKRILDDEVAEHPSVLKIF